MYNNIKIKHTQLEEEENMEKPGLEHAVMILGAGAAMLQVMRNMGFTFVVNRKEREKSTQNRDFSNLLQGISGWTAKAIMALIFISNVYQLFFSGVENGRMVYFAGICVSVIYFMFFAGFKVKVNTVMMKQEVL